MVNIFGTVVVSKPDVLHCEGTSGKTPTKIGPSAVNYCSPIRLLLSSDIHPQSCDPLNCQ